MNEGPYNFVDRVVLNEVGESIGEAETDADATGLAAELNRLHRELEAVRKVMETSDEPREPTDDD
jgi:hypothetical protein